MGLRNLFKKKTKPFDAELKRVEEALAYMRKWNDIPLSLQQDSLCKILGIDKDEAARQFCIDLLTRIKSAKDAAQELLNCRLSNTI